MITTHVLDTARGRPAADVAVVLDRRADDGWSRVAATTTDADGRARLVERAEAGVHRLTFATGDYLSGGFYPEVPVVFEVTEPGAHHHVPLLLSPWGYTTYRGS